MDEPAKKRSPGVTRRKKKINIDEGDLKTVTGRFIAARKCIGLSPAELSRELDISRSAVCRIENGKSTNLRASTLMAMERITHHRATWISEGTGPRYVDEVADAIAARQLAFSMSPDQLRESIIAAAHKFSRDDARVMIDALLDRLHSPK